MDPDDAVPLKTKDIGAARANWHPQVHQLLDEDLYFILFRFTRPRDISAELDELMAEAGIQNYSAYIIFGYFDGLLRVWLTPHRWQLLLRCIARRNPQISETRYLKVAALRYLWSRFGAYNLLEAGGPSEEFARTFEGNRPEIQLVARDPLGPPIEATTAL